VSNPRDERPDDGPYYGDQYSPTEPRPSFGQQLPPWESAEAPGGRSSGNRPDFTDSPGASGSRDPDEPRRPDEPRGAGGSPRWVPGGEPGFGDQSGFGGQAGFGGRPANGAQNGFGGQQGHGSQPRYSGQGGQQEWERQPDYGGQGDYGQGRHSGQGGYAPSGHSSRPGAGGQDGYGGQGGYGGQQGHGSQPRYGGGSQPGFGQQGQPDSGGGYQGQPGFGSYATSRVYGAPRGPQGGGGGGEGAGDGTEGRPGKGRKRTIIITSAAAAVVIAVAAVVFIVTRPSGPGAPIKGFVPTAGSTPSQAGQQIATAFLTQWADGNYATAASYTDDAPAAQAAMASYGKYLGLTKMTGSYQSDTAVTVSPSPSASAAGPSAAASASAAAATPHESVKFSVNDAVSAKYLTTTLHSTWGYHSTLVAYQEVNSTGWYISWQPGVLAPNLTTTTHLATVSVAPKVDQVTDGNGQLLTSYNDPGLNTIAQLLAQNAPPGQGASPGLDVEIQNAKNVVVPYSQATLIKENDIPSLATTISPQAESAARAAVTMHKASQMVVIQPSTGDILAIANNDGFNDFALTSDVAPGSTMKIITSTSLFNSGTLTASSPVQCPKTFTVQGITYHNDNNETLPAGTPFSDDFAQSCNNAFTTQYTHLTGQYSLAATAKTYYGLDEKWGIGIPGVTASYFNAPPSASGSELAQEAFGEGQLSATPLAMASVAATVDSGSFKQPILLNNTKQVTATALPAGTDANLKTEMRAVVTSGTAANLGFGSDVYAKTGTADIVGQDQPNAWFVAFAPDKDVAVACLVLNAGYGAQVAAPEVLKFLNAY